MTLFFYLVKCCRGPVTLTWGRGLIYLDPTVHGLGSFLELQTYEEWLFLVTPISLEAHATVCTIGDGVEGTCADLFPKNWTESNFLMGNIIYVYKEIDHSDEA